MKRALFLLLLAACGDDKHATIDAPPPPIDAAIDAPAQMGVVTVTALDHQLTEAGDVTVPVTSGLEIIDSTNAVIQPSPSSTGTLQFVNVAPGPYMLCDVSFVTRAFCVQGSTATIDISKHVAGRNPLTAGASGTQLDLTVTGLTPAPLSNEFLDVRSLNTNWIEYPAPPTLGTTLMQTIDYHNLPLLAAADVLRVTQLVTKTSGTETYVAAVRSGSTTGVAMTNGAATNATVDLSTTLPQSTTKTFNLRRSQFTSVAGSAGPNMTYQQVDINGYSEARPYEYQPWVFYYTGAGNGTQDLPLTITYGNPTPSTYVETFEAAFWFTRTVTAPGATTGAPLYAFLGTYRPSTELTGDITPKLSRPTGLKVNGSDASTAQNGTGVTPTISWTAPAVGTASHYQLAVYRVINQAGATVVTSDGLFTTTGTSLKIPPGFVHAGEPYIIGIRAWMVPSYNPLKPNDRPDHYDLADTTSDVLTP